MSYFCLPEIISFMPPVLALLLVISFSLSEGLQFGQQIYVPLPKTYVLHSTSNDVQVDLHVRINLGIYVLQEHKSRCRDQGGGQSTHGHSLHFQELLSTI